MENGTDMTTPLEEPIDFAVDVRQTLDELIEDAVDWSMVRIVDSLH